MLELEHSFRAVDVSAALDPDLDHDRGRAVAPDRLERELHQAGVVRAVVAPRGRRPETLAEDEGYLAANNSVARLCVDRPFVPFARIAGARDVGGTGSRLRNLAARRKPWHAAPEDVERYAYGDRFEGFVLDPAGDGLPDEAVLGVLADVGLPVRVHANPSFPPRAVERTLLEYGFPVVLAGFGGYPLDRERMADAVDLLDAHDELYLDTAAVRFRDVLERVLREHPDRVLFGSDAPAVHPSVGVMELLTISVPEDAMRRAFESNPIRVVPSLGPGE
ncbi:amidohydrolase [Halobacteriales archaeon QS_5_70_15]|nr:MAG: amidohydrolase [Halobacteriales archaeon QS_5_70_15]